MSGPSLMSFPPPLAAGEESETVSSPKTSWCGHGGKSPNLRKMRKIRTEPLALARSHQEPAPHSDFAPHSDLASEAWEASVRKDDLILRDFFQGTESDRSRLYRHVLPSCLSTIGRMLGPSHPQTEDLLQSAVELVVKTLVHGTFSRRCSLKTWAAAITRNLVKNEARIARRNRRYLVDEDLDTYADEEDLLCAIEQGEVRSAVQRLPGEMAQALLLHDLCGYTAAEVAEKVGLTSAGAQSRISRARDLARRNLESGRKVRTQAGQRRGLIASPGP